MRSILITGASSGIGRELACQLARPERRLLLAGRNAEALAETRADLPGEITTAAGDLVDGAFRRRLVDTAIDDGVNMLINNAGAGAFGPVDQLSDREISTVFATNVQAPLCLIRDLLPQLRTVTDAQIVNIGSTFGTLGFPGQAVYAGSKFALRGATEALRREVDGQRVKIQYIAPRATRTRLNPARVRALNEALGNRMDSPASVARAIIQRLPGRAGDYYLGWPEKLFVRLNMLMPGIIDGFFRKHRRTIDAALNEEAPS